MSITPFYFYYRGVHCIPLQLFRKWYWTATIVNGEHRIPVLAYSMEDLKLGIDKALAKIESQD